VFLLGVFSFLRLVQTSIEDMVYALGSFRIRLYQVRRFRRAADVAPELYEGQSPTMPGWTGRVDSQGRTSPVRSPPASPSHVVGSHGDDDLAAGVACFERPHGLGDLPQRVGPADAWPELAGLDELPQDLQVLLALLRDQHPQPLAHEP
jgi:hypothetical protein